VKTVSINNRKIGYNQPVYIIAEASANHGHDFDTAVQMIHEAKKCKVDAVKFQAYTPDSLTIDVDSAYFRIDHPEWGGQTLYQLYQEAYTPLEWIPKLKKVADEEGITFLCTAFDKRGIKMLEEIDICAHKIASFEMIDSGLVSCAAKTGKPLILSTGMSNIEEIYQSVSAARSAGVSQLMLMKCVSGYPASPEQMNLRTISHMQQLFECPVGLSDHSIGTAVPIASVALGANCIEKHFTLDPEIKTPDSFFSISISDLKKLVEDIRIAEKALGKVSYKLTEDEKKSRVFRRSLFVVKDIRKGEEFTEGNVKSIRPGYGLKPKYLNDVLGKRATRDIEKGTPLRWDLV